MSLRNVIVCDVCESLIPPGQDLPIIIGANDSWMAKVTPGKYHVCSSACLTKFFSADGFDRINKMQEQLKGKKRGRDTGTDQQGQGSK